MKVSIILPTHNEEDAIGGFLKDLSRNFPSSEIIVVCNACTDKTTEIVREIERKNIKLMVIPQPGKGNAILRGFEKATGDCLGFIDSDGAFKISDIKKVISEMKHSDCVIASKWKGKGFISFQYPMRRKVFGRIWNLLVAIFLGLRLEDTQTGMKFMKKTVYNSIDKRFISSGFEFDVELLKKVKDCGFSIKEVQVSVKESEKSSFSLKYTPKMFYNLLKIWAIG